MAASATLAGMLLFGMRTIASCGPTFPVYPLADALPGSGAGGSVTTGGPSGGPITATTSGGSCGLSGAACTADHHCCAGEICKTPTGLANGTCCTDFGGTCTTNGACCNADGCNHGRCCQKTGSTCAADADCCNGAAGSCDPSTHTCVCVPPTMTECEKMGLACGVPDGCYPDGTQQCMTFESGVAPCQTATVFYTGTSSVGTQTCPPGFHSSGHLECVNGQPTCVAHGTVDYCDSCGVGPTGLDCGACSACNGPCVPNFVCSNGTCTQDLSCPSPTPPNCWNPSQNGTCQ